MGDTPRARLSRLASDGIDLWSAARPKGVVRSVGDGVLRLSGIPDLGYEELLRLDSGGLAMAFDITQDISGAVLLTPSQDARAGEGIVASRELPGIPVGEALLGRVINARGEPLDGGPSVAAERRHVFRAPPELTDRVGVTQPLQTGVMVLDAAVPIGRGQRQLLVGDRNVGKTALALDIVAAQQRTGVVCVYVVVGQPLSRVLSVRDVLAREGALAHTVVVAADAASPPGLQYIAPYAGTTVAEWFRDRGQHALVVIDDLTKHADAYRELALLLDRPPGREAYPGDIFYIHAELLERATALRPEQGGGSLTTIPLAETTDGDISAYIPTNLISITDGQIYLDTGRFQQNLRPAVDIGRSVSRVGGAAQSPELRVASRNLRMLMSRFESLEALTRVGLEVDATTQTALRRGRLMRELLRQGRFEPRGIQEQVATLTSVTAGLLDTTAPHLAREVVARALSRARERDPDLLERIGSASAEAWADRWSSLFDQEGEAP